MLGEMGEVQRSGLGGRSVPWKCQMGQWLSRCRMRREYQVVISDTGVCFALPFCSVVRVQ